MRRFSRLFIWLALLVGGVVRADEPAVRVIVLANSADADSVRIAKHYAEVRGVPAANVVALPMPLTETINWTQFVTTVWQPLQDDLVQRRWIDAIPMKLVDAVGRTKMAFSGHRISFLVICRGVPLRIMHDPQRYVPVPPVTDNPIFRTNASSVDSELSLLAHPNHPINGFVQNPLYHDDHPTAGDLNAVVKVTRLDGPEVDDALRLVDQAVAAERTGLIGRAYVDLGGNHPDGDRWLESTARQLADLGFDTDADRSGTTFPATARFDHPVLYFGWYASGVNGPFTQRGFRFPPGAVALHIHSYSAQTLRSPDSHWCGPLIARGVTATVGNVFEPYLQLTHRPDLMLRVLARGGTWGDAVAYAQPALSWQTVAIGDPLYRPFVVALPAQWANRGRLSPEALGYVVVRRMLQLEAGHQATEALARGRRVQGDRPSLALGLALASRLGAQRDWPAVADVLALAPAIAEFPVDQWGPAAEAATWLARAGRPEAAVSTLRTLLAAPGLPESARLARLAEGVKYAQAAGDGPQADLWRQQIGQLEEITRPMPGGAK